MPSWVQAMPDCAGQLFPSRRSGSSDPDRSSMTRRSLSATNPEGWQRVAGGRSAAKTPGSGFVGWSIPEGWQSSATPPGSMGDRGSRTGGLSTLDPRLPSGKPPACGDRPERNQTLGLSAAGFSVCGCEGRLAARRFRRQPVPGGCGLALRSTI